MNLTKSYALFILLSIVVLGECALKSRLKVEDMKRDINDHFCCKVDPPLQYIPQTKISSKLSQAGGQHKCGYQSCGFLGWGSCTKYCWAYWSVVNYYTETYTITQETPCPADNIVCCKDYLMIKGHCFHLSEVQSNTQLLLELANEGVIVPAGGFGK